MADRPHARARIEIKRSSFPLHTPFDRPHARARIEIPAPCLGRWMACDRPHARARIEMAMVSSAVDRMTRPPSREGEN